MKTCLLLLCLVAVSTANLLRQQFFPQLDMVFQPLDNIDYQNFFARPESQERLNYDDYPLPISKEKSPPYFTKTIQRESPKHGDVITWRGIQIAAGPKSTVNDKKHIVRIFDDAYKTLQHITDDKKKTYHDAFERSEQNDSEDANMNATQLLMKHQYSVEEHVVRTDDGYILTMFRVLPREQKNVEAPVVFLMHGLLGSADDWLLMDKSLAYMLADAGPLLRMMSPNSPFYDYLQHQLGYGELKLSKELVHTIGGNMCQNQIGCKHICGNVNFVVTGMNPTNIDADLVPVIMSHVPAGASTRQIKQYSQAVAANELRKYDFGAETNTQVYGNSQPPRYNMTDVKVPVALYYSDEDWMAHPRDVERLQQELPDVRDFYRIPDEHFNHMDFQFSRRAPVVVNQRLVDSIRNYH
ncbi:unnamed protein product [Pieris brassicae]|uniref:Partial AB-hydrolase lipase domain-containing protein n=1 Tax=Pieris brassicae TaxID=7116 RepID=A0A9P0X919_PIEBR|nr:unnamed protein product [Pieris brassicae]